KVTKAWEEKPIELEFKKFSCITFDNSTYWASLMPDKCEKLHEMHGLIARVIEQPTKKSFDPHMTLMSTKNKEYEKVVNKFSSSYVPVSDNFVLSLGKSDDVGQLTEVLHCCDVRPSV